jgi:prepilin-type N-terminal cleavage/methylation domain-containing protein
MKKTHALNRGGNGFTLAELLIVVAIIAVLVAIAIPIFNNRLEASREAVDVEILTDAYNAGQRCCNAGVLDDGTKVESGLYAVYNPQSGDVIAESTYNKASTDKTPFKTKVSARVAGWQGKKPDAAIWENGKGFYNTGSNFAWTEYEGDITQGSTSRYHVTDKESVVVQIWFLSIEKPYFVFFFPY